MSNYDNTNRGALFRNDKKETEKHPDYKGSINVNGQELWLSAWIQESKAGVKYMSMSVQPKDQQRASRPAQGPHPTPNEFEDDIPFAPVPRWV